MAVLGELEQQAMAVLWRRVAPLSVREVHEALVRDRRLAYTTVMTVLDRLAKKGVVERQLDGRAWLYRPLKSCVELHVDEILDLLRGCGEGHGVQIIAGVIDRLDEASVPGRLSCHRPGDPSWVQGAEPTPFIRDPDAKTLTELLLGAGLPEPTSAGCAGCDVTGCPVLGAPS